MTCRGSCATRCRPRGGASHAAVSCLLPVQPDRVRDVRGHAMNDDLSLALFCLLVVFFHLPFWESPTARAVTNFVDRLVERVIVGVAVAVYFVLVLFGWAALIVAVLRGGLG